MNEDEIRKVQMDATQEALHAKQEYEIAEQTRKVDAIAQQVYDRCSRLADLASEVKYAAQQAPDQTVNYPAGAFHHDADSIDALLQVLTQESSVLDTMRTAKAKTDDMTARYQAIIDGFDASPSEQQEVQPIPMPAGVSSGVYL